VRRITALLPNCCIVLFGSRAYGQPHDDSDIDLLVIVETDKDPVVVAGDLYLRLRPRLVSVDVVVMTPETVRQRLAGFDPFLEEATGEGRVLYGQLP
jgi:predicted nucleotidyltransferase